MVDSKEKKNGKKENMLEEKIFVILMYHYSVLEAFALGRVIFDAKYDDGDIESILERIQNYNRGDEPSAKEESKYNKWLNKL